MTRMLACTPLAALWVLITSPAHAACDLSAPISVCASGSSGPLNSQSGDHVLSFPPAGSGSVIGDVTYGPGNDRVDMQSGSVKGSFNLGAGTDSFNLTAGSISGDVNQGPDRDDFTMSGGTLHGLAQGDGLDRFFMSGGTITAAFEDGDSARMTGGTIGRVDMKLDDNLFELSGGTILGNLVTGFGRDTIIVSGGRIGGQISVSGGDDRITLSGGEIGGVRASFGNDLFQWQGGGQVKGSVLMAEGDDTAVLRALDETLLASNTLLDGGPGNDKLTFDATHTSVASRYRNWETVNLDNGARLDLDRPFILGDDTRKTGVMNIGPASTLSSTAGALQAFDSSQPATLNNAGIIDLSGPGSPGNSLLVQGNYQGLAGQLKLQTALGDDQSNTDRLVVSAGTLGGTTAIAIDNAGGSGALTLGNGIEVVQARNGATSQPDAFTLQHGLSAGAYQYYLFRGGITAGSEHSWFLRSSLPAIVSETSAPTPPLESAPPPAPVPTPIPPSQPAPPPTPPISTPQPAPEPAAPQLLAQTPAGVAPASHLPEPAPGTPPLPTPQPQAQVVPLYRLEVANYSATLPSAATLTLMTLGNFHERQGEQSLLDDSGVLPAAWGRGFGQDIRQRWHGQASPGLDGSLSGYQIGHDLWASQADNGRYQRLGLFVAQSRMSAEVQGFAEGFQHRDTGQLRVQGDSIAAYWTLSEPQGPYLDLVAMGTRLEGKTRSSRGVGVDIRGHALSLSVESGFPQQVSERWKVEPQLQLVRQYLDLDSRDDGIARIGFDAAPRTLARIGLRAKGRYTLARQVVEPYARVSLRHQLAGHDAVIFDDRERIDSQQAANDLDLELGVAASLSPAVSLYLSTGHSCNLDGNSLATTHASLGVRVSW